MVCDYAREDEFNGRCILTVTARCHSVVDHVGAGAVLGAEQIAGARAGYGVDCICQRQAGAIDRMLQNRDCRTEQALRSGGSEAPSRQAVGPTGACDAASVGVERGENARASASPEPEAQHDRQGLARLAVDHVASGGAPRPGEGAEEPAEAALRDTVYARLGGAAPARDRDRLDAALA